LYWLQQFAAAGILLELVLSLCFLQILPALCHLPPVLKAEHTTITCGIVN